MCPKYINVGGKTRRRLWHHFLLNMLTHQTFNSSPTQLMEEETRDKWTETNTSRDRWTNWLVLSPSHWDNDTWTDRAMPQRTSRMFRGGQSVIFNFSNWFSASLDICLPFFLLTDPQKVSLCGQVKVLRSTELNNTWQKTMSFEKFPDLEASGCGEHRTRK